MGRITNKHLDMMVARLNKLTGNHSTPYDTSKRPIKANIGNYHISGAYGGVSLHQIMNDGGGIDDIFRSGHMTKRELYNRISAYIDGIESAQG